MNTDTYNLTIDAGSFELRLPSQIDYNAASYHCNPWMAAPLLRVPKRHGIEAGQVVLVDIDRFPSVTGKHVVGPYIEDHGDGTVSIRVLPYVEPVPHRDLPRRMLAAVEDRVRLTKQQGFNARRRARAAEAAEILGILRNVVKAYES